MSDVEVCFTSLTKQQSFISLYFTEQNEQKSSFFCKFLTIYIIEKSFSVGLTLE